MLENRITFLHIPLKYFGLSDDLYIKMNARGKALTDFEKFKAKFEQFLEKKYKDLKKDFTDKIDGGWTDLFWDYKDSKTNLFDELFINFFRVVAINHYAYSKEIDNEFEINISLLRDKKQQISFEKYFELDCFDSEYVALISCVLDKLSQNRTDKIIKVFFTESNYFNEISIFNGVIENSLGYADMVKFYGYSQFLFNEEIINTDETNFIEWMRVVRNLVEGSKLTYYINATVFANSIKAINKLVMYRNDILTYFSNLNEDKLIGFLQIQINEEILKAKLILKNAEWRKAIITIENHGYFNGQIGFLLEFSGIDEYLKKNGHINWDNNENKEYFNIFLNYTEKIKTIFNSEGLNRFEDYIFERALLAKGDYLLKRGRNYSFLIDSERDISWKRLLRDNNENRKTVKLLLDSINLQTLQKELQNIIDNFSNSNDWRYYFIKYPEIIKSCGAHKLIRCNDDFDILLLGSSTTSGYHKEYFSYALYLKLENIVKNIVYNSEKSREVEKTFTIGEGEITISFVNAKYKLLVINSDEVQYFDTQEEVIEFLSKNNFLLD